jgi:hypothetical protein
MNRDKRTPQFWYPSSSSFEGEPVLLSVVRDISERWRNH